MPNTDQDPSRGEPGQSRASAAETDIASLMARATFTNAVLADCTFIDAFGQACKAYKEIRPEISDECLRAEVARLIQTALTDAHAPLPWSISADAFDPHAHREPRHFLAHLFARFRRPTLAH